MSSRMVIMPARNSAYGRLRGKTPLYVQEGYKDRKRLLLEATHKHTASMGSSVLRQQIHGEGSMDNNSDNGSKVLSLSFSLGMGTSCKIAFSSLPLSLGFIVLEYFPPSSLHRPKRYGLIVFPSFSFSGISPPTLHCWPSKSSGGGGCCEVV